MLKLIRPLSFAENVTTFVPLRFFPLLGLFLSRYLCPLCVLCFAACRYIGMPTGVLSMYPGTLLDKSFEPTQSAW